MTDTLTIGLIAIGIGLSPYVHLVSGLTILLSYYLMVILSMATCIATGVFRISFNGVGPTEIRLLIIACTAGAIFLPTPVFDFDFVTLTVYDFIIAALNCILLTMCFVLTIKTLMELAAVDPPRR